MSADELSLRRWENIEASEENRIVEKGVLELRAGPTGQMVPEVGSWECGMTALFCRFGWLYVFASHQPR